MVVNATFNNISGISWRSVLLVEVTGVPGENHRPATIYRQTLSHNVVSNTHRLSAIQTHNVSGLYVVHGHDFKLFETGVNKTKRYRALFHFSIPYLTVIVRFYTHVFTPISEHQNSFSL
jgi:hypothetical protein